jgi:hypothetical protein
MHYHELQAGGSGSYFLFPIWNTDIREMKSRLMYVELKTGYSDKGPAWIGRAFFSKTGKTIYFNGLVFLKGERHSAGNHLEYITGDSYWVSGVKKDRKDRHWAGGWRSI